MSAGSFRATVGVSNALGRPIRALLVLEFPRRRMKGVQRDIADRCERVAESA